MPLPEGIIRLTTGRWDADDDNNIIKRWELLLVLYIELERVRASLVVHAWPIFSGCSVGQVAGQCYWPEAAEVAIRDLTTEFQSLAATIHPSLAVSTYGLPNPDSHDASGVFLIVYSRWPPRDHRDHTVRAKLFKNFPLARNIVINSLRHSFFAH